MNSFFSMLSRMKYIDRWGLMRNTNKESLSEHTLEVCMLSHALAVIGKVRLEKAISPEHTAMLALYHDASEIITGDMPTPIKYFDENLTSAYKKVEEVANDSLFSMLPSDLANEYKAYFKRQFADEYSWQLVKAADKISALIKCVEEEKSGNSEFKTAKATIEKSINEINLEEVTIFMTEFFPAYRKTLDEMREDVL